MNKAFVKIQGGLGNQLHCYAFGKALEKQHNIIVTFDIYTGFINDKFNRLFKLHNFKNIKLSQTISYRNKSSLIFFKILNKFYKIIDYFLPLSYKCYIIEPSPYKFQKEILNCNYKFNPYFNGYWASYKYYNLIRDELIFELKPNRSHNTIENYYYNEIINCNSCFLHYRTYKEDVTVKHEVLTNYYIRAVSVIKYLHPNVKIFVFSDDLNIAKNILNDITEDMIYVENTTDLIDFYLMNQCNHSIIADSTFSWWAAWLNTYNEKKIIYPKGLSPWGDDWAPEDWILINYKD